MKTWAIIVIIFIIVIFFMMIIFIILPRNKSFDNMIDYINYYDNWIHKKDNKTMIPYNFKTQGNIIYIRYFTDYGMHKGIATISGRYTSINNNIINIQDWNPTTASWNGSMPQPQGVWTLNLLSKENIKITDGAGVEIMLIRS